VTGVLDDNKFVATTCKSCHPVTGDPAYAEANRAPALSTVMPDWHAITDDCSLCHQGQVAAATRLSDIHTGYNSAIYDASGQKYSSLYQAAITSVSVTDDVMDIKFTANNTAIVPMVTVSFYGYDTKDFLLSGHTADATLDCISSRTGRPSGCTMEKTIGVDNPRFTEEADSVPGAWHVTLDLAAYVRTPTIPEDIAAGKFKFAEVAVLPTLVVGTTQVALDAPSKTVDLATDLFVDNHFQGTAALVSEAKCNACHDALATTFHTPDRGGNIVVCRTCHVPTSGGSHLEMQSRSIDSYVHAIHSFQAFDSGDIDFLDPVEAARYALHIEHVFPNFTIKNCEGCHVSDSVINVPDQGKSLGGLLSGADTWNVARNIGSVPAYLTGPASRACGSCHRAGFINEDAAGELAGFNGHVETNGYLIEDTSILYDAIDKIQSLFN
jgi:OmcA/MtrC family decaheme c-type cytochrome